MDISNEMQTIKDRFPINGNVISTDCIDIIENNYIPIFIYDHYNIKKYILNR